MSTEKTLVIVESPKKEKSIQKYLGNDYIVRSSAGHIADLVSTPNNRLGVDIEKGFKPTYSIIPDKKDRVKGIIDALGKADKVCLATDPDREGEAIAWHLFAALKTKKPVSRVLFKEITKNGIKHGIENPCELDKKLFDAQQARRVLDRLVGFMVSDYLRRVMNTQVSAGRVQSVAVKLIVDREREIESFKPDEYWPINATLAKTDSLKESFSAKYNEKVTTKDVATKVKADLEKDTFEIINVIATEKAKKPFPPLTTATLQQVASRKYGMSATRIMKAAQALYESGVITYHRTDSVRIEPDSIKSVRKWLEENKFGVPTTPNVFATKNTAQDAHEAIRPTDVSSRSDDLNFSSDDEQKVYSIIWEKFVASQMQSALFDTVAVTIKSSSGLILKANGRILKYKGWLEITDYFDNDDDKDVKLPQLRVGDILTLVPPKVKIEQKFTKPPPRYKDHSFIEDLEKRGIGRPSTYATILTKVTDRNYVEKKKDTFFATDLGKDIVDKLSKFFSFMNYDYTANMELQLDKVEGGELKYVGMLGDFFKLFKVELKSAISSGEKDYGINCTACAKPMRLRHGKFGYYMACDGYPECKSTFSCDIVDEKPVKKASNYEIKLVDGVDCPKCQKLMQLKDGKFGKFYSCSAYPKCNGSRKVPYGKKCSKCGNGEMYATVFDGNMKLACMEYPNCKNIEEMPKKVDNWVDPKELEKLELSRTVKKMFKSSSKKSK